MKRQEEMEPASTKPHESSSIASRLLALLVHAVVPSPSPLKSPGCPSPVSLSPHASITSQPAGATYVGWVVVPEAVTISQAIAILKRAKTVTTRIRLSEIAGFAKLGRSCGDW